MNKIDFGKVLKSIHKNHWQKFAVFEDPSLFYANIIENNKELNDQEKERLLRLHKKLEDSEEENGFHHCVWLITYFSINLFNILRKIVISIPDYSKKETKNIINDKIHELKQNMLALKRSKSRLESLLSNDKQSNTLKLSKDEQTKFKKIVYIFLFYDQWHFKEIPLLCIDYRKNRISTLCKKCDPSKKHCSNSDCYDFLIFYQQFLSNIAKFFGVLNYLHDFSTSDEYREFHLDLDDEFDRETKRFFNALKNIATFKRISKYFDFNFD